MARFQISNCRFQFEYKIEICNLESAIHSPLTKYPSAPRDVSILEILEILEIPEILEIFAEGKARIVWAEIRHAHQAANLDSLQVRRGEVRTTPARFRQGKLARLLVRLPQLDERLRLRVADVGSLAIICDRLVRVAAHQLVRVQHQKIGRLDSRFNGLPRIGLRE